MTIPFLDRRLDEVRLGVGEYWDAKTPNHPLFHGAPGRTINSASSWEATAILPPRFHDAAHELLGK